MPKMIIQFDDSVNKILNELSEKKDVTKAEIIRRALSTYKFLDDAQNCYDQRVSITTGTQIIKDVIIP